MIYLDLNGRGPGLVGPDQAYIPASDRGLLYGDGLFETMLLRDGEVPLLPWHMERLCKSAEALRIPCDRRAMENAINAVTGTCAAGEYAIRLTLTRGPSERRGYQPPSQPSPTLLITASPYIRSTQPLTAITATVRINPDSPNVRFKSISALEKVMAREEAARAGADEALLLNLFDRPVEGAQSSLFVVRNGRWLTPELSEGCLAGVMRRRVMNLTRAVETGISVGDLFVADAVYLCNSLMGLLPLVELDGRPIPRLHVPPFAPEQLFAPVLD